MTIVSSINSALYSGVVKPVCFQYDPENVHNFFLNTGKKIEKSNTLRALIRGMFHYNNPILTQELHGIIFQNPVGLSAGFDKNAEIIPIIGDIGFGFTEVGSITAKPCPGNPGKRLIRLPENKSIWVNFGLNNDGTNSIIRRLAGQRFDIPVGISVAKTNCKETVDPKIAIDDYVYSLRKFEDAGIGDYFTINISCPNAYGGQPFSDPKLYLQLMKAISKLDIKRPIFVKLSPDLKTRDLDSIIKISKNYKINGFVCSNLTKVNTGFDKGGVSGKMVSFKADRLLSHVYKNTRNWSEKPTIIGVGGVFSAEDAYRKIRLGANLVQMITGMIYQGPGIVGQINMDLVKLLKKDGFKNVSEAVGATYSKNKRRAK